MCKSTVSFLSNLPISTEPDDSSTPCTNAVWFMFFFNFPSYYLDLFSIAINQWDHLELGPQNKLPQIPILSDTAKTTRELFTPVSVKL